MALDSNQGDWRHTKATRHDSRRSNLRTTLELVSDQGATSRAEIARLTGLSRAAVSSLVGELIDHGLLRELGQGTSAGGKPPTLLALNERGRDIVAIDLGHRPFPRRFGRPQRAHPRTRRRRSRNRRPGGREGTRGRSGSDRDTHLEVDRPGSRDRSRCPGVISPEGTVLEATNLDWHGFDLGAELRHRFDIPVSIANDAAMAALFEFRRRPTDRNLILVKLGRGVGAGVVLDGALHRGRTFGRR